MAGSLRGSRTAAGCREERLSLAKDEIGNEVRKYIAANFLFDDATTALTADTSFLASGIIDSTGILEVISFLEERFGITVADDEILPENLDSIGKIEAFVLRKTDGGA
jgi:acyl carrier protein